MSVTKEDESQARNESQAISDTDFLKRSNNLATTRHFRCFSWCKFQTSHISISALVDLTTLNMRHMSRSTLG